MDYIAPENIPYFTDCEPLVNGFGFKLVELSAFKRQSTWQIRVVLTGLNGVGIADCSHVHRALLPRLEAVLSSQDMYVEVMSPGLDRILKNAYEFTVFLEKQVKVWNTDITDWVQGTIVLADTNSVTLLGSDGEVVIPFTKIAKAKLFSQS